MPVDRMYMGAEPLPHPTTGELIELDDRDGLFKAYMAGGDRAEELSRMMAEIGRERKAVLAACDRIVYALAGQDVTRLAATEWARDQIDQGC